LAQRDNLSLLLFAQDIAHANGGYSSVRVNVLTTFSLAVFQVTTIGRIWVTAEAFSEWRVMRPKRANRRRRQISEMPTSHSCGSVDAKVLCHETSRSTFL